MDTAPHTHLPVPSFTPFGHLGRRNKSGHLSSHEGLCRMQVAAGSGCEGSAVGPRGCLRLCLDAPMALLLGPSCDPASLMLR